MNKIMKAGAGVAAVAATVAAGALVISAFGPADRQTYTMEEPADKVTFNSITNNSMLNDYTMHGDERYFVEASPFTGSADGLAWSDNTVVENGKEYVVHMYVHNDAASNLNLVAENTRASVNLPTDAASSITVAGMISADNATPNAVWDETTFTSADGKPFTLKFVDGSTKFTNCNEATRDPDNKACNDMRTFDFSTEKEAELRTEYGTAIGYNDMDGKYPGCIAYAGWLSFHVIADFGEEPSYTVEKKAMIKGSEGTFEDEVFNAKDGDTILYGIEFENTGNTTLYNVNLRDLLPESVEFQAGTTRLWNDSHDGDVIEDSIATEGGLYIGDYAPGARATVVFEAIVKEGTDDKCDGTDIQNKIQAIASTTPDGSTKGDTVEDIADVYVDGKVCTEGYELDKMVRLENDTEWSETVNAKAGEKVYYRIRFFNTGETDLDNVVLSDNMPEHMTNISEVKYGPVTAGDSDLKVGEGFFGDGMNIGTVKAGETYAVYFHATVDEALAGECEDVTLENVVTGKYGNNDGTIKTDNAFVEVDGQVCTEDHPGFTINKMVQIDGANDWKENVNIKANDTVRYRIQFKNTGNTTLENVVIRDNLPEGLHYVEGSTILYNAENTEGKTMGDEVVNGGLNIGNVEAGSEATIYFYAKADKSFADDCGSQTLQNVVSGKYNNDDNTTKTDTADVTVDGMVCDVPEYPNTGAESNLGAIIATAMVATAAAGYIVSRKK